MRQSPPIVSFKGVSFSYDGKTDALRNIDLEIPKGEFLCILGGNGSGKTTLAKMINGLLAPTSGEVITCSMSTSSTNTLPLIRQYAGMVFQNPDDQLIGNTIEDDVAFGPENLRLPSEEIRKRVDGALRDVGLSAFADRETQALSGGQKQRVAIAAALAMRPDILVLDEAGSMLDPRGRRGLIKECKRLNEEGLTIILVTHFLDEVVIADRVIVMRDGRIAQDGAPDRVLSDSCMLARLDLETPFGMDLCQRLHDRGIDAGVHLRIDPIAKALIDDGFSSERANAYIASLAGEGSRDTGTHVESQGEDPSRGKAHGPSYTSAESGWESTQEELVRLEDVGYSYLDRRALKKAAKAANKKDGHKREKAKLSTGWGVDPEEVWALKDITFSICEGDFLGVIGHTGSGKSTLVRILADLVEPTSGKAFIQGMPFASKQGKKAVRETIGIVMQYPEKQLFAETVFKDCAFGPRNLGLDEGEVRSRVETALGIVGLKDADILEKSPFRLSGGQQRRVAIAGVLAMEPKILVLDEPTAGLDPAGCRMLLELIRRIHEEYNVAIVIVSHNMDSIANNCNKVVVLNKGRVYLEGSPLDVFSNEERLSKIGLALPSTLQFSEKLGLRGYKKVPNIEHLTNAIVEGMPSPLQTCETIPGKTCKEKRHE